MNRVEENPLEVASLYRFVPLPDYADLQKPQQALMRSLGLRGTLLLAAEGVNGTVAGPPAAVDAWLASLRSDPRLADLEVKRSRCAEWPFRRARVRLKREIVTMGVPEIDPHASTGTHVDPREWNALITDPEVIVIDTRNDYEVAIGSFRHAIDPETSSFGEFPAFVDTSLDPGRHRRVAMYCTGGIRCEKATAYLQRRGFEQVYQLRGGILRYLEEIPREDSLWLGECFVFDGRVAVDHELSPGSHAMCFACGWAVSEADRRHPDYRRGVHCPRCVDAVTEEQRARFAERQRQVEQQEEA